MMPKLKAVFFDLDDTLVPTSVYDVRAYADVKASVITWVGKIQLDVHGLAHLVLHDLRVGGTDDKLQQRAQRREEDEDVEDHVQHLLHKVGHVGLLVDKSLVCCACLPVSK